MPDGRSAIKFSCDSVATLLLDLLYLQQTISRCTSDATTTTQASARATRSPLLLWRGDCPEAEPQICPRCITMSFAQWMLHSTRSASIALNKPRAEPTVPRNPELLHWHLGTSIAGSATPKIPYTFGNALGSARSRCLRWANLLGMHLYFVCGAATAGPANTETQSLAAAAAAAHVLKRTSCGQSTLAAMTSAIWLVQSCHCSASDSETHVHWLLLLPLLLQFRAGCYASA